MADAPTTVSTPAPSAPSTPSTGGSSSPSGTPSAPGAGSDSGASAPGAPAASGADSSFDFMDAIFSNGEREAPTPPTGPVVAPGTEPKPLTPPASEPVAPAAAPPIPDQSAPPVTDPPGTSAALQAPAAPTQSPRFNPADPHTLAQALSLPENTAAAIEHLMNGALKLTPHELEAIESDPASGIPRILAKAVVFAQQQMLTQLGNIVPLMIQGQQKVTQAHEQSLGRFYSAWPALDRTKHHEKVAELGVRYRQMFPNNTLDQMIEHLGPMVLAASGLPISAMTKVGTAAPAASAQTPPAAPIKPQGFTPANPGTVVQTQQVDASPFDFMGGQSE